MTSNPHLDESSLTSLDSMGSELGEDRAPAMQTAAELPEESGISPEFGANSEEGSESGQDAIQYQGPEEVLAQLEQLKSSRTNGSKRVPIMQRRGILAQVAVVPEFEDAREYSSNIKHLIVFIVAFAAICGPMGTSIMLPAIDDIVVGLDTLVSVVNVSVGIYLLSLGIFPLWWSAFSEKHGRRSVYIVSFSLFVAFSIGCALSPNIGSLLVFRVLSGGCSASVQAVGAGTIGDLYEQHQRGRAMGWYYLGPLMGPFLAPILGGVVAQVWGWRATQWVLVIASGIADVLILFLLPETLRKQDDLANVKKLLAEMQNNKLSDEEKELSRQPSLELQMVRTAISAVSENTQRRNSQRTSQSLERDLETQMIEEQGVGDSVMPSLSRLTTNMSSYSKKIAMEQLEQELSRSLTQKSKRDNQTKLQRFKSEAYEYIVRPLHSLALLGYPPVLLVICYSSILFALVYFFNITISYEYSRAPYNFATIITGLLYIPNSVTYILASIIGGRWNDKLLKKYAENHNGDLKPEARISWNIVVAVVLFPPACLIFGWTLDKGVHWVVPLVGTALFGFASMLVIGTTVTYLVDTLPGKGATGVALNNLIRQILAAIGTFVVEPLIRALGTGVLYSILTGIITVASIILIILKKRGDTLRQKYDLGSLYDKL